MAYRPGGWTGAPPNSTRVRVVSGSRAARASRRRTRSRDGAITARKQRKRRLNHSEKRLLCLTRPYPPAVSKSRLLESRKGDYWGSRDLPHSLRERRDESSNVPTLKRLAIRLAGDNRVTPTFNAGPAHHTEPTLPPQPPPHPSIVPGSPPRAPPPVRALDNKDKTRRSPGGSETTPCVQSNRSGKSSLVANSA
jgi:hypothetical protein